MKNYNLNKNDIEKYKDKLEKNIKLIEENRIDECIDPDKYINQIYIINSEEIKLGTDGICGIKYLKRYYNNQKLKDVYITIRNKIIVWPKHIKSINQRRYQVYRDRIDFTIFDIKMFYENKESNLVVEKSKSERYLNKLGNFKKFIEEYELQNFVNKNYEVYNLASNSNKVIKNYQDYEFSEEINKQYLINLVEKLEK